MADGAGVRIGIDLTALLPQRTGIDTYLIGLVTHLARVDAGNRYRLFVNREDRDLFAGLPPNFEVSATSLRPRPVRLVFQQAMLPLASTGLDVLHSPAFLMPVAPGRTRHLLTIADMTFFSMPEHHAVLRRSWAFRRAVLSSIRRADRIAAPSEATKRAILDRVPALAPERIDVIPHGVGDRFRQHTDAEIRPVLRRLGLPDRYVLHVGTIEPRKNLEALIDAYATLVRGGGRIDEHLVLVGKLGWGYDRLLERLDSPDLRARVHLPGYVAEADLPKLYAGARLFAAPSWGEGFGFPPLEAMASGVPVIAGRTSALTENLEGAAELVAPEDPAALSSAIDSLLHDEARSRSLSKAGIDRAARFGWESAARRHLALYLELAGERRSGRAGSASSSTRRPVDAER